MPGQRQRPLPPSGVVLIVQNLEKGMVLQPASLSLRPALEDGMSSWILLTPGGKQGIPQGSGPLLGQAELHTLCTLLPVSYTHLTLPTIYSV